LTVSYVPQRDVLDTMLPITVFEVTLMGREARFGALQRPRGTDRVLLARALTAEPDVHNPRRRRS